MRSYFLIKKQWKNTQKAGSHKRWPERRQGRRGGWESWDCMAAFKFQKRQKGCTRFYSCKHLYYMKIPKISLNTCFYSENIGSSRGHDRLRSGGHKGRDSTNFKFLRYSLQIVATSHFAPPLYHAIDNFDLEASNVSHCS